MVVGSPPNLLMEYPTSTGEAARALSATEPQLNDLIRRGKIHPEPPILAGRRLWHRTHLLQAAQALGILTDHLRAQLAEEVA
jgi:hypothetical protein